MLLDQKYTLTFENISLNLEEHNSVHKSIVMRALKMQPVAADLRYDQRGDALWGLSEAPGKFEKSFEVWKQKK